MWVVSRRWAICHPVKYMHREMPVNLHGGRCALALKNSHFAQLCTRGRSKPVLQNHFSRMYRNLHGGACFSHTSAHLCCIDMKQSTFTLPRQILRRNHIAVELECTIRWHEPHIMILVKYCPFVTNLSPFSPPHAASLGSLLLHKPHPLPSVPTEEFHPFLAIPTRLQWIQQELACDP